MLKGFLYCTHVSSFRNDIYIYMYTHIHKYTYCFACYKAWYIAWQIHLVSENICQLDTEFQVGPSAMHHIRLQCRWLSWLLINNVSLDMHIWMLFFLSFETTAGIQLLILVHSKWYEWDSCLLYQWLWLCLLSTMPFLKPSIAEIGHWCGTCIRTMLLLVMTKRIASSCHQQPCYCLCRKRDSCVPLWWIETICCVTKCQAYRYVHVYFQQFNTLKHWGRDKMAATCQTTFSITFS